MSGPMNSRKRPRLRCDFLPGLRRAGVQIGRVTVVVLVLSVLSSPWGIAEQRYPVKWEWSPLQANEIKKLAANGRNAGDGFWELRKGAVMARTDISKVLAAEVLYHAGHAIKVFPQVVKLPPSATRAKNVRIQVTIHAREEGFDSAVEDGDPDVGFSQATRQEDGSVEVEIHLLSAWEVHPGFDNNLVECIDVGLLQGHLARLIMQLWRPEQPLPPFLAKGYESFYETFDVYKKASAAAGVTRGSHREALRTAILQDKVFRPNMSQMLHLSAEEFDEESALNEALADRFVHFLMKNSESQLSVHRLLAQSVEGGGTRIDFKAVGAMQSEWHRDLYRILARSRLLLYSDVATEAPLPGAASVSKLSAYGNKPSLSLMPAEEGAYDLAWHNRSSKTIHIMRCDADGRKIAEFSPSFIQKAGALLGATRLPGGKTYVTGYSMDNAHGNKNSEFWIAGFDPSGAELFNSRIFGEIDHSKVKSKGGPGGAGTARIAYNEKSGTIGYYLSHNMLWGDGVRHQGGFVGFLNEKGRRQSGGNGWFYSHNFDQRLIVANGDFCALAHGDAYPRALGFSRWSGSGGKKIADQTYHQIPGETGDNTTNCQTGGLVALPNRRYAVVFASSNEREGHDVCIKILDESGKITREKWLTKYKKGGYGAYPRIARDGEHIFLAWHQFGGESGSPGLQQMVLDPSLETHRPSDSNRRCPALTL